MTASVLQFDKDENRCVLRLRQGQWADRSFGLGVHICENPFCGCENMDFECVPLAETGRESGGNAALYFSVDVHKRCLADGPEPNRSPASRSFAKAVETELTETDWRELHRWFLGLKQKCIENANPDKLDAVFPPQIMSGEGTMVGYSEIFPFARAFEFEIGKGQWLVDDQYCVDPDCDCRETVLQFVHVPEPSAREQDIDGPAAVARYDYRTGRVKTVARPAFKYPRLKRLIAAMKGAHPTFDADVEKRHNTLKDLYRRALTKAEKDAVPFVRQSAKIGRNDPCPCGSGKKYKKCCGSEKRA